jgi:hypothetical protein
MPIVKVDGQNILDTGTLIAVGTDAVIEVVFDYHLAQHQVALKFRNDTTGPSVRFGNPQANRTVVHLANFPKDIESGSSGVHIGKIGNDNLWLSFWVAPMQGGDEHAWRLTYTLYARG